MDSTPRDRAFEDLVRRFLTEHPQIQHQWRDSGHWFGGGRRDLVCGVGTKNEVFASFNRGGQITIGLTGADQHQDFEDFGRGLSDDEVAREAFNVFAEFLREHNHLVESNDGNE